jgi:iron complex transport system substrate-binding protein
VSKLVLLVALGILLLAGSANPATVPHRIVSLSPTATETLFALGAGKQVIAVDDQSDYPKQAPRTKLSGFTPNAEAIIGYHPDLVVISYDPNGLAKALATAHIRVVVQQPANTFATAYAQIRGIGQLTGHVAEASRLVGSMQRRIARLVKGAPKRALAVYHEISPDFYSATSKSIIGAVYKLFGLRNIADAAGGSSLGGVQLSSEAIVAANPDLIVLTDIRCCGQTKATVASRPGWHGVTAVRRGTIALIDDSLASRWGPRLVDFVRAVASALRTVAKG